jgi:hypothetical protein
LGNRTFDVSTGFQTLSTLDGRTGGRHARRQLTAAVVT